MIKFSSYGTMRMMLKTKLINFKGFGPKNLSFINFKFTLSNKGNILNSLIP